MTKFHFEVILFKPTGEYHSKELWRAGRELSDEHPLLLPDVYDSPDFRRVDNGPVLILRLGASACPRFILPATEDCPPTDIVQRVNKLESRLDQLDIRVNMWLLGGN